MSPLRSISFAALWLCTGTVFAADVVIAAVAANFEPSLKRISASFTEATGIEVAIVTGSTGQLYAQITRGAPFDVFLAADTERPTLLVEQGLADAGDRFTYAVGKLVVWSPSMDLAAIHDMADLRSIPVTHAAIANPRLAPYGAAAEQALRAAGLWDTFESKLVFGQSVGQAFAMASSRNAQIAFVALAQVPPGQGSLFIVPAELHEPLRQDVVLLRRAGHRARELFDYLRSPRALTIITADGYLTQ
jgi:molybdate transport system substrate-binding protein